MKRLLSLTLLSILCAVATYADSDFARYFRDATLRLDYTFTGDSLHQQAALDEVIRQPGTWCGRRHHLDSFPTQGYAQLTLTDSLTGRLIYCHSFATLFQEWTGTEEAARRSRSFQNVVLIPEPRRSVVVSLTLRNFRDSIVCTYAHPLNPADILIRRAPASTAPVRTLISSGTPEECIDITFVAEGYTKKEMKKFYREARQATEALFSYEPFRSHRSRFNVRAVGCPSAESGVSVPRNADWRNTALSAHFDTFYSDRYLTTLHLKDLHDVLAGIPTEHIIILANTSTYGGGGIYNFYNLAATGHKYFLPVVVHEFGHSFAALADEYAYDDQYTEYFYPDREPWEANLTTLVDFPSKWADLVGTVDPVCGPVGTIEGGGYQSKGVWRPCADCRMRTNTCADFCPVCRRELLRLIRFYTE